MRRRQAVAGESPRLSACSKTSVRGHGGLREPRGGGARAPRVLRPNQLPITRTATTHPPNPHRHQG
jgi:hypothetical protein